jgi:hypothetical protein
MLNFEPFLSRNPDAVRGGEWSTMSGRDFRYESVSA